MTNTITVSQAGFEIDSFYKQCDELSKKAANQCGCVYEIYQRKLSSGIDALFALMPADQQSAARAVAVEVYDYRSPAQIEQDIQADLEAGYCVHALDPQCCPMGCGDLPTHDVGGDEYMQDSETPWWVYDTVTDETFENLRFDVVSDIQAIGAKYDAQITAALAGLKG